ncbi:MAG: protein-methionine-sulfoxide reductase catalytic subunit MsrP [Acidobacteriota bacterium]
MSYLKFKKAWDRIPASQVTSESTYSSRRHFLQTLGSTGLGLSMLSGCAEGVDGAPADSAGPAPSNGPYGQVPPFWTQQWEDLFPAARNPRFQTDRGVTAETLATGYNNFHEFTTTKQRVKDLVKEFDTDPWKVEIRGEVEKKGTYDLDDLIRMGQLEERLYHLRCVEAWSANIPWTGYPLSQFIEKLNLGSDVKYVRFLTLLRPAQMPGQRGLSAYNWPYYEALSIEEAMNELTLLTFGIYGHPLNKQSGAPIRIVVPWKYGFKSIKSIVLIEFTKHRPRTFWSDASKEYGFWANAHPRFDHPRWSQASEIFLNTKERLPTQRYNGYQDFVGHLYPEDDRRYFY